MHNWLLKGAWKGGWGGSHSKKGGQGGAKGGLLKITICKMKFFSQIDRILIVSLHDILLALQKFHFHNFKNFVFLARVGESSYNTFFHCSRLAFLTNWCLISSGDIIFVSIQLVLSSNPVRFMWRIKIVIGTTGMTMVPPSEMVCRVHGGWRMMYRV